MLRMNGRTYNLMTEKLRFFEAVATKKSAKSGIVNLLRWTRLHHFETTLVHFQLTKLLTKGFCHWSWRCLLPMILSSCFVSQPPGPSTALSLSFALSYYLFSTVHHPWHYVNSNSTVITSRRCLSFKHGISNPTLQYYTESTLKRNKYVCIAPCMVALGFALENFSYFYAFYTLIFYSKHLRMVRNVTRKIWPCYRGTRAGKQVKKRIC